MTVPAPQITPPAEPIVRVPSRRERLSPWLLLSPSLLLMLIIFVGPLLILLVYSFYRYVPGGTMIRTFTIENYTKFLTDLYNLGVLWNTLRLGISVTVLAVLLGFPVAFNLARLSNRSLRGILYSLLLVPLMTSVVVRSYGWMVILGSNGVVNTILLGLGVVKEPLQLLYTPKGTIIALVAVLLPFMVISLVPVIQNIDRNLELVAQSLGATGWRAFLDIVLPLSMPGVAAGSLLVFSLSIAAYATPALVGGTKVMVMPLYVYQQAMGQVVNWPFGSAISFILLGLVLFLTFLQTRLLERNQKWGDTH